MRLSEDNICNVCKKVFCCPDCRYKHAFKTHDKLNKNKNNVILPYNLFSEENVFCCPLCEEKPIELQRIMDNNILKHIEHHHLPLHCQKCKKVYDNINDLQEFSNCKYHLANLNLKPEKLQIDMHPSAIKNQNTISTQTSPFTVSTLLVPKTNLICKQFNIKKKIPPEDYISDSVSSIKNLSLISNGSMRRSISVITAATTAITTTACTNESNKGKLVRTTSTPVQPELLLSKQKEQTFNAFGAQVSSIYNSECDTANTPANRSPSSKQIVENLHKFRKIGGRSKMTTVTPLRQVMSKSIQKAFAEHGVIPGRNIVFERNKTFDSFENSSANFMMSGGSSPLDLRVSPVVRRSQKRNSINVEKLDYEQKYSNYTKYHKQPNDGQSAAIQSKSHELLMSSQKLTTESIVITHTQHMTSSQNSADSEEAPLLYSKGNNNSKTVFTTCQSVEIITATKLSGLQVRNQTNNNIMHDSVTNMTPISREPGAIIPKKFIKFETPNKMISNNTYDDPNCSKLSEISSPEIFLTPQSKPFDEISPKIQIERKKNIVSRKLCDHLSPKKRPSIRTVPDYTVFKNLDLSKNKSFEKPQEKCEHHNGNGWSLYHLMNSVIGLPSAIRKNMRYSSETDSNNTKKTSIFQRCASIAGSLVRSQSFKDSERQGLKRKRTYNTIEQGNSYIVPTKRTKQLTKAEEMQFDTKRFRIQPRRPIHDVP